MRTEDISSIDRDKLYRGLDGELYEVVGFIDRPAVILHRVSDGYERVIVASAPIADDFKPTDPAAVQGELIGILRRHRRR